jgi:hypothetical protein
MGHKQDVEGRPVSAYMYVMRQSACCILFNCKRSEEIMAELQTLPNFALQTLQITDIKQH